MVGGWRRGDGVESHVVVGVVVDNRDRHQKTNLCFLRFIHVYFVVDCMLIR